MIFSNVALRNMLKMGATAQGNWPGTNTEVVIIRRRYGDRPVARKGGQGSGRSCFLSGCSLIKEVKVTKMVAPEPIDLM